jgi:Fur family transcriptional regulator, peroxide stress response regulator
MAVQGRLTRYRRSVLDALRATEDHPTAAEVFRSVRRRSPGVAYATIYNALNWLEHNGYIARLNFSDQAARYDPVIERHDHLICTRCGAMRDVSIDLPARLWSRAARSKKFRVERHRTELFGLCTRCARSTNTTRR